MRRNSSLFLVLAILFLTFEPAFSLRFNEYDHMDQNGNQNGNQNVDPETGVIFDSHPNYRTNPQFDDKTNEAFDLLPEQLLNKTETDFKQFGKIVVEAFDEVKQNPGMYIPIFAGVIVFPIFLVIVYIIGEYTSKEVLPSFHRLYLRLEQAFLPLLSMLKILFVGEKLTEEAENWRSIEQMRLLRFILFYFSFMVAVFTAMSYFVDFSQVHPTLLLTATFLLNILSLLFIQFLTALIQGNSINDSMFLSRISFKNPGFAWVACIVINSFLLPFVEFTRPTEPNVPSKLPKMKVLVLLTFLMLFSLTSFLPLSQFHSWHLKAAIVTMVFLMGYVYLLFVTLTNKWDSVLAAGAVVLLFLELMLGVLIRDTTHYNIIEITVLLTTCLILGFSLLFPIASSVITLPDAYFAMATKIAKMSIFEFIKKH